jgi:hypothetical protein
MVQRAHPGVFSPEAFGEWCAPFRGLKLLGVSTTLGMMARLPSIAALRSPLEGELGLGEDSFAWPHPTRPSKALFVTDDAVEGVTREVAS